MYLIQITLTQWEKSQRTAHDNATREAIFKPRPLSNTSQCFINNTVYVDEVADVLIKEPRVQFALNTDNILKFDRFLLDMAAAKVTVESKVYDLQAGWLAYQYSWRKRVRHDDKIFWLYETFQLNIAHVEQLNSPIFMATEPAYQVKLNELP